MHVRLRESFFKECHCFSLAGDLFPDLCIVECSHDFPDLLSRRHAEELHDLLTAQKRFWRERMRIQEVVVVLNNPVVQDVLRRHRTGDIQPEELEEVCEPGVEVPVGFPLVVHVKERTHHHVMTNSPVHSLYALSWALQPLQHLPGDVCGRTCMVIEPDPFLEKECFCFPNVMEKGGPPDIRSMVLGERSDRKHSVVPHVSFLMEIRRLCNTLAFMQFRNEMFYDIGFPHVLECPVWSWPKEHFLQLLKPPVTGEDLNEACMLVECLVRIWVILAVNTGTETDSAEKTQRIVPDACSGIANEADETLREIVLSSVRIENLPGNRVEVHAIDRNVATLCIGFPVTEGDGCRKTAVTQLVFLPESCEFKCLPFVRNYHCS